MLGQHELELEDEYEAELEDEGEEFLGNIVSGISSLLGEGEEEYEYEDELEGEFEDEFEMELENEYEVEGEYEDEGEEFLGGLVKGISGLLGEGEEEYEDELEGEFEYEDELEGEYEFESEYEDEGEEFFKGIGRLVKRAAPMLKRIAKTAAPLVATAVGGPAAGMLAKAATSMLEGEYEDEDEAEAEMEAEEESRLTLNEAMAELLAADAARARSESEAEAMVGASTTIALSPRERRQLESVLPHLVRGAAVLTRALYRTPTTRGAVRTVPTIVHKTTRTLSRRAAAGKPVNRKVAARVMANHTRRTLGTNRRCAKALRRNARGTAIARRRQAISRRGPQRGYPRRTTAPRPGQRTMRVSTPVRIPPRNGRPARVVRVVTAVPVPRGARPVGRSSVVAGPARRRI